MESLYFLIPLGVVLIGVAIGLLYWAVNSGQYDDLDSEGERILFDDERYEDQPSDSQPTDAPESSSRTTPANQK